jgi:HEAT repeat protein
MLLLGACLLIGGVTAGLAWSRAKVTGGTPAERIAAICRLADEQPAGAREAIIVAAQSDPDATVRQAAFGALGRFLGPDIRPLVESGTASPDAPVRAGAARTLGLYGDAAAARRLGQMLSDDPDAGARLAATRALAGVKPAAAMAALVKCVEFDADPAVRREAALAIYAKMQIRLYEVPDPTDKRKWAGLVGQVKSFKEVRRALEEAKHDAEGNVDENAVAHPAS